MFEPHIVRFYLLLTLGMATIAMALVNMGLTQISLRGRLATGLTIYSTALLGLGMIIEMPIILIAAGILGGLGLISAIDGKLGVSQKMFGSRARISATLASLGLLVSAGSLFLFNHEEEAYFAELEDDFEGRLDTVPLQPVHDFVATTDRGRELVMKMPAETRPLDLLRELELDTLRDQELVNRVMLRTPADEVTNCHGWVFTGGRYWVSGADVDSILQDNGYRLVDKPQPGDLVIYRREGEVAHTAVVRYVTEGRPVLVEGKWGPFGVYLHEVDQSCYHFGYHYYSTNRPTHLLREFADPSLSSAIRDAAACEEDWDD